MACEVGPLGTIPTQILVPWEPAVFGHLARWLRRDQVAPEADLLGTNVYVDPGHQRTRAGILVAGAPQGWGSGNQVSHGVGPRGTTRAGDPGPLGTTHLWPSGGRLGEWLREDQVTPETDPLATTTVWILVTRGPDPDLRRLFTA